MPLVGALLVAAALLPLGAAPASAVAAGELVTVANTYRAAADVPPVSVHEAVQQIASERSDQMAASGVFAHDFDYVTARLAQLGVCWKGYGEIIAWHSGSSTPDFNKFGQQWFNSTPHRTIMQGVSYNVAGGGVATSAGRHYGTMIFVNTCVASTSPAAPTVAGYTDMASSAFGADIAWLVDSGITTGCAPGRFCPTAAVSREQMASFLGRALKPGAASRDYFVDDWASVHQADINRVAEAGVTGGCSADRYCPGTYVSRGQMAAFLVRALALPPAPSDYFFDDESSMFEDAINRLAASGITGGCAPGRFCPDGSVTREQMAAFLHRAFGG
jgi:hypothetical protein